VRKGAMRFRGEVIERRRGEEESRSW